MSDNDANKSAFIVGDIVLQNPKETAVIFTIVVILSIFFENLYGSFRSNKSRYIRMLFTQVSEEILIIGSIGLIFVLIVQSFSSLPAKWVLLLRWTHTVLFFMMVFFVIGIVITAGVTRYLLNRMKRLEERFEDDVYFDTDDKGLSLNALERSFLFLRKTFVNHLRTLEASSSASPRRQEQREQREDNSESNLDKSRDPFSLQSIPFSKYLEVRSRETVVKYTDVTWQCWLSLVLIASINSIRLFLLPGDLQAKQSSQFTAQDRLRNNISFILVVGFLPFLIFLSGVAVLVRNFRRYEDSAKDQMLHDEPMLDINSNSNNSVNQQRTRGSTGVVWLPPKQLTQQLLGEVYEDPSHYLPRSNRGFTLHMLKVPAICLEFYLSLFVVGMWGEMGANVDVAQGYVIPLALLPILGLFVCLPFSLVIVTLLTSLGSRLDPRVLRNLYMRRSKMLLHGKGGKCHGKGEMFDDDDDDDEEYENWFKSQSKLGNSAAADDGGRDGTKRHNDPPSTGCSGEEDGSKADGRSPQQQQQQQQQTSLSASQHQSVVNALKARIRFLEDLCQSCGVPLGGRSVDARTGEYGEQSAIATVCAALAKLEQQTSQLREQQSQLVALQRCGVASQQQLGLASGGAAAERWGAGTAAQQPGASASSKTLQQLQAISAAKRFQQQQGDSRNNVRVSSQRSVPSHVVGGVSAHLGISLGDSNPPANGAVTLDRKHHSGSTTQFDL